MEYIYLEDDEWVSVAQSDQQGQVTGVELTIATRHGLEAVVLDGQQTQRLVELLEEANL